VVSLIFLRFYRVESLYIIENSDCDSAPIVCVPKAQVISSVHDIQTKLYPPSGPNQHENLLHEPLSHQSRVSTITLLYSRQLKMLVGLYTLGMPCECIYIWFVADKPDE